MEPPRAGVVVLSGAISGWEGFDRLLELHSSPANAITFCQGNFRLMTDDLPGAIHHFGAQGKIAFVHMRDVSGTRDQFVETWHDAGPTDMVDCFVAYREIGFEGVMRADHVPSLLGEENLIAGYGTLGRLFAVGYLRGLQQAVFH